MRSSATFRLYIQLGLLLAMSGFCAATLAERNAVTIYRCQVNGVLTFADRPCGAASEVQEIDTDGINTVEAPAAPKSPGKSSGESLGKSSGKPQKRKSGGAASDDRVKQARTCDRLIQSLRDIRSKMRSGYKASEGERLKERQAKLKNQLRLARCS